MIEEISTLALNVDDLTAEQAVASKSVPNRFKCIVILTYVRDGKVSEVLEQGEDERSEEACAPFMSLSSSALDLKGDNRLKCRSRSIMSHGSS